MSRQRKIEIWTFVLGVLLQGASYGFFLGRLTQSVQDLGARVERLEKVVYETQHASLEVKK